jgi:hypothetical protein
MHRVDTLARMGAVNQVLIQVLIQVLSVACHDCNSFLILLSEQIPAAMAVAEALGCTLLVAVAVAVGRGRQGCNANRRQVALVLQSRLGGSSRGRPSPMATMTWTSPCQRCTFCSRPPPRFLRANSSELNSTINSSGILPKDKDEAIEPESTSSATLSSSESESDGAEANEYELDQEHCRCWPWRRITRTSDPR